MVEPVNPLERRELDGFEVTPRPALPDDLGLEQTDDRFGQRVIVGVADAADRRLDAGFGQALGVTDRDVLHPTIAMMDQSILVGHCTLVEGLLSASNARSVRSALDARQPTIRRE